MKQDKIEITLQIDKDEGGLNILVCYITLNNKEINHFCEFSEFMFTSKDNRDYWTKNNYPTHKEFRRSNFEPFTCSCGTAGCAGIWDGIYTKYRKRSIEWRIPRNRGYDRFLDKTFFSFDRQQYQTQVDNLWKFIEENKDVMMYDDKDAGYWDDTTEEWVDEVNFVKLGEKYKWLYEE